MPERKQQLLICEEEGLPPVQVRMIDDSAWLSQSDMAELFGRSVKTINEHLQNIFEEGELDPKATIRNFRIVQTEGERIVQRATTLYNLDAIISVGYRVNSKVGTIFRKWATKRLNQYLSDGFVINETRFADPSLRDLDALVDKVRKIRTSEKVFYQKVRDIFATSTDYNKDSDESRRFYQMVQNLFHYAITGMTAAELIVTRIDPRAPLLGMSTHEGNNITFQEACTAKNYLIADEMKREELLVEQFLSFAELRALEKTEMTMRDWVEKIEAFFALNDKPILRNFGRVSNEDMKKQVTSALKEFNQRTKIPKPRAPRRLMAS